MSIAEENRLRFVDAFNKAIGDKAGRPMTFMSDTQLRNIIPEKDRQKYSLQLGKKIKEPAAKKVAAPKKGKAAKPGPTSAADILKLLGKGPKTDGKTVKTSAGGLSGGGKEISIDDLATLKNGADENVLGDLWHTLTGNPVSHFLAHNPVTAVGGHALGAVLDATAIPGHIVAGAAFDANERSKEDGIMGAIGGAIGGAYKGLTGEGKQHGMGDLVAQDSGLVRTLMHQTPLGGGLDAIANYDTDPSTGESGDIAKWADRLQGGIFDVATDPTTYYTGGVSTVEKLAAEEGGRALAKAGAKGALNLGKDALKNRASTIVKHALDEHAIKDIKKVRPGSTVTRSLSDHIIERVHGKIDDTVFDMRKGGMIGGGPEDIGTLAGTVSEATRDALVDTVKRPAERYTAKARLGKRFTDSERRAMKTSNPLFGQWLDIAERIAKEGKYAPDEIHARATKEFIDMLNPKVAAIRATVTGQLEDALLKVPTVEFMGKKMYFPKLGKVSQKIGARVGDNPYWANASKAMRYSSWFPGYSTHISQKMKAMNVQRYDEFKNGVEALLRDTTPEQRRNIHRAIQEGIDLPGVDGDIQKAVKQHYSDMWEEEIKHGARTEGETPFAENYVYNTIGGNRKLDPKFNDEWKKPKKKQVQISKNIDGYTSADAIKRGWKVEEDVGQALVNRKAKSIRELSRVNFKKDLIMHYGIKSSMDPRLAAKAHMHLLDPTRYAEIYKKFKLADGEKLFLDHDIEKIYDNYNELVKYGSNAKNSAVALGLDNVNKLFKTANTIYWPGFHVRNAISDVFMGMLDGVGNHRYEQIMRGMTHKDTAFLKVGNERVPFRKIYKSYLDNAASAGFFDSEMKHNFDPRDLSTMKYMNSTLKGGLKHTNAKLRDLSQHREDFGRLVHYYHALDDEMGHQLAKGIKGDVAWKNAEEAAIERVNKFKFDYNALTPNEQWIRRFGMPFYTYMRKATPVLMENVLMNPKHFARINRLQEQLAPSDEFKASSLPGWMQEMAYSELSSGNHIGFTDALFPTRTLHETFSNPITRANPMVQGLFEYASGKDSFSGKPVGKGITGIEDILKNKMRVVSTWRSIESDTKPTLDKWAGLFGIPLVQVSAAREGQKKRELEDEVVKKSATLNKKLMSLGLKVRVARDHIELIQPKSPTSDELAHNMKQKYPTNDKEKVIGTYQDFNELMTQLKAK